MIPSVKRQRTEESSFTSVALTSTSAAAGTVISAQKGKSAIIQPYPATESITRVSVLQFFYSEEKKNERDLFLRAMGQLLKNTDTDDPWSYYAIAGIHGLPQKPYDSAIPPEGEYGYCEHGTVLFPTWHRPYVLLFEQAIIREAENIANNIQNQVDKDKCLKTAKLLRVPYLDWESSFTAYQGIPDVFTRFTIDVTYPKNTSTTIPNPLRSYVLPVNLAKPISASDVFNPTAKPNYQPPESDTPFTPACYPTVRHPNATYQSPTDTVNLSIQRFCNLTLRPQLYAAMLQTNWHQFSNHYSDFVGATKPDNKNFYGHFASIEVVHDAFHDAVGGTGGHMSYPDIAAFDPIFWFHHCNVDRLIAIWQYANPNAYVPDSTATSTNDKNKTTPLTPFWSYKSNDGAQNQYLTSVDVQYISDWNYTYPAIQKAEQYNWSPDKMKCYIVEKFRPDNHYGIRWYLNIVRLPKRLTVGPYEARVFIDLPDANIHTELSSPHYAGNIFVFARSRQSNCRTCEKVPYISGSVDLTATMKGLGIPVDTEIKPDGTPSNPFHTDLQNFTLVYVTVAGQEIKLDEDPSVDSTGRQRTKPSLTLSWTKLYDNQATARGDMKPEQLDQIFKSYSLTGIPRGVKIEAPKYEGGIIELKL